MFHLLISYSYASLFNSFNKFVCSLFISISFCNWLMILLLDSSKCLILCDSVLFSFIKSSKIDIIKVFSYLFYFIF